ncbi:hypothetical protein C8Q74DRAFT_455508 [Fomes fomentarius]|nr:hypothetical protein C8Q74DRAFT_455508 [Fomes fomentarius]
MARTVSVVSGLPGDTSCLRTSSPYGSHLSSCPRHVRSPDLHFLPCSHPPLLCPTYVPSEPLVVSISAVPPEARITNHLSIRHSFLTTLRLFKSSPSLCIAIPARAHPPPPKHTHIAQFAMSSHPPSRPSRNLTTGKHNRRRTASSHSITSLAPCLTCRSTVTSVRFPLRLGCLKLPARCRPHPATNLASVDCARPTLTNAINVSRCGRLRRPVTSRASACAGPAPRSVAV